MLAYCDAGVIPYWVLAPPIAHTLAVLPLDFVAIAAQSQMTYAACIISFLGGLHWALAMVHQGGSFHFPPLTYLLWDGYRKRCLSLESHVNEGPCPMSHMFTSAITHSADSASPTPSWVMTGTPIQMPCLWLSDTFCLVRFIFYKHA